MDDLFSLIGLNHDSAACDCETGDHEEHYYYVISASLQAAFFKCLAQAKSEKNQTAIKELRVAAFGSLSWNEESKCDVLKWKLLSDNVPVVCLPVLGQMDCIKINDPDLLSWIRKFAKEVLPAAMTTEDIQKIHQIKLQPIQYVTSAAAEFFDQEEFVAAKQLYNEAFQRGSNVKKEYAMSLLNTSNSNKKDWKLGAELLYQLVLEEDPRTCSFLKQKIDLEDKSKIIQEILRKRLEDATIWTLWTKK